MGDAPQPAVTSARSRRRLRDGEAAVSDIVGNILLVAITVIVAGGLTALTLSQLVPRTTIQAELQFAVDAGDDVWGNGDEVVLIAHGGGESLPEKGTTVRILVGGQLTTLTGAALGSAFSDGSFDIGETWTRTATIGPGARVGVDVLGTPSGGGSQLLGTEVMEGEGCASDSAAPTVASVVQSPPDIDITTIGAVAATITLVDDCSGPSPTDAPHLFYRLNSPLSPPFVDLGPASPGGTGIWTASIPDPGWALFVGKTLQYYMAPLVDYRGNSGTGPTVSDLINIGYTYPSFPTVTRGNVLAFGSSQSALDGGAEATLAETGLPAQIVYVNAATGTVTTTGTPLSAGSARGAPDDVRATLRVDGDSITISPFATGSGGISKVEIGVESHFVINSGGAYANDQLVLSYLVGSTPGATSRSTCITAATTTDASAPNPCYADVTNDRAAWTWTDIGNLKVKAAYVRSGGDDKVDFLVDSLWVRVTPAQTYAMDIRYDFVGAPPGTAQTLELRYRVAVDTFNVEVFDFLAGQWNIRGLPLTSATVTTWSYSLTDDEFHLGAPAIRFTDLTSTGTSPGSIGLDYARVTTS